MVEQAERTWLAVEERADATVVSLARQTIPVDAAIRAVNDQLDELGERWGCPRIVLDCGGVQHLSSALVAKLFGIHQKAIDSAGRLALCAIEPELLQTLRLAGLDELLNLYSDEQTAMRSFAPGSSSGGCSS